MKNRAACGLLIFALAAGTQWNCRKTPIEEAADPAAVQARVVKAERASRREWVIKVPISGNLRSLSTVEIKPEVGGQLIAVYFAEGDLVQKGQLLAEIDPVNYRLACNQAAAALETARAGLERARVMLEHARTEKERADNLLRSGGITQKDHQAALTGVKEAETGIRLAEAQCDQARAVLAIAEKALKDCRIFAPAGGHVQNKFFDMGSLLAPGVTLFTLVDNSRLEMECLIPSYQLAKIRLGQSAGFMTPTWGEQRFSGVVSAINPTVEFDNRSVRLKLKISNPGGELRNGMYARGEIIVGREKQALIIPRDALIPGNESSGRSGIYVVKDGKAHRIEVEVGGQQHDQVWIRRGIEEGDMVITEIGPSLQEGIPVQVRGDF